MSRYFIILQVYIFVLIWLLGMLLISIKDLAVQILIMFLPMARQNFLNSLLDIALFCEPTSEHESVTANPQIVPAHMARFVNQLTCTTVLTLHVLRQHGVNSLVMAEIVRDLWNTFLKRELKGPSVVPPSAIVSTPLTQTEGLIGNISGVGTPYPVFINPSLPASGPSLEADVKSKLL